MAEFSLRSCFPDNSFSVQATKIDTTGLIQTKQDSFRVGIAAVNRESL